MIDPTEAQPLPRPLARPQRRPWPTGFGWGSSALTRGIVAHLIHRPHTLRHPHTPSRSLRYPPSAKTQSRRGGRSQPAIATHRACAERHTNTSAGMCSACRTAITCSAAPHQTGKQVVAAWRLRRRLGSCSRSASGSCALSLRTPHTSKAAAVRLAFASRCVAPASVLRGDGSAAQSYPTLTGLAPGCGGCGADDGVARQGGLRHEGVR